MNERLTIVTTTHLPPSAPSTRVLRATVDSLRRRMDVAGCRHLVYYDRPTGAGPREAKYLANLARLSDAYGLELHVRPRSGLKKNLLEAVDAVETPYMLFLEHDWAFRRPVPLGALLDVFDKYDYVNHVRFNMRSNDSHYMWDHLVEPEDRISELNLTRTSSWSNNPHVARMSKWRSDWLGIVGTEPASRSFGIEEKLYFAYNREIFNHGFWESHAKWGQYIFGGPHARPYVAHINGSLNTGNMLEYAMKAKRLARRVVLSYTA